MNVVTIEEADRVFQLWREFWTQDSVHRYRRVGCSPGVAYSLQSEIRLRLAAWDQGVGLERRKQIINEARLWIAPRDTPEWRAFENWLSSRTPDQFERAMVMGQAHSGRI